MNFKAALKQAADNALASQDISAESHAEITAIAEGPGARRAASLEGFAAHHLVAPAGAVDWANLIQQLQTLLPFILQIIALFKKP